ncbi:MAG TPA: hypothetical protein VLI72_02140 [Methylibium sp.]|nr:hypothetical protein [Methylibium sp.]
MSRNAPAPIAPPSFEATWPLFEANSAVWSQYLAMQSAWLAPWAEWQAAWLQACGLPTDSLPSWPCMPVGGEPLP